MSSPTDYNNALAQGFASGMKDKLDQAIIDDVVQSLKATSARYFAEAAIYGYVFYGEIEIRQQDAPHWVFKGHYGGLAGV
jgi:hypothetical protein